MHIECTTCPGDTSPCARIPLHVNKIIPVCMEPCPYTKSPLHSHSIFIVCLPHTYTRIQPNLADKTILLTQSYKIIFLSEKFKELYKIILSFSSVPRNVQLFSFHLYKFIIGRHIEIFELWILFVEWDSLQKHKSIKQLLNRLQEKNKKQKQKARDSQIKLVNGHHMILHFCQKQLQIRFWTS